MTKKKKVMIVEDSPLVRKKLIIMVEELGYKVESTIDDSEKIVEVYGKFRPHMVLMDMGMLNILEHEGMKSLMKAYPKAKVIMVSGLTNKMLVLDALRAGAKHFIAKPFDKNRLQELLVEVDQMPIADEEPEDNADQLQTNQNNKSEKQIKKNLSSKDIEESFEKDSDVEPKETWFKELAKRLNKE